jgi:2-dehydropantoate 2-reductase
MSGKHSFGKWTVNEVYRLNLLMDSLLIVGTGALANLFAARFVAANIPVTVMGNWPEGVTALRERGVILVGGDGSEKIFKVDVVPGDEPPSGVKLALVLVKSWQTERAAKQLGKCLDPDGLALTLQNGIGNREKLVETLGIGRAALGVTTSGATLLGPGRVRPGGEGIISLEEHPQINKLDSLFTQAGFEVDRMENLDSLVWGKLVVNTSINPLTALLRVVNGKLLESESAWSLMAAAARETAQVAAKLGVSLPFDDPALAARDVARRTAGNHSSMLQDVNRGAPTEIDAICGAVVRAGKELGVPTPINRTLWLLVRAAVGR